MSTSGAKPLVVVLAFVVCAVAATVLWQHFDPLFPDAESQQRARRDLAQLADRVTLGTPRDAVTRILQEPQYRGFRILSEEQRFTVVTPTEFGARNWTLLIDLSDGRVVATRVRTEDSNDQHPSGAPADKEQQKSVSGMD